MAIDPQQEYSLYAIVKQKLISGIENYTQMKTLVNNDALQERILDAKKVKSLSGVRYIVKGENIIKYLKTKNLG
jgi:hypothetical protein